MGVAATLGNNILILGQRSNSGGPEGCAGQFVITCPFGLVQLLTSSARQSPRHVGAFPNAIDGWRHTAPSGLDLGGEKTFPMSPFPAGPSPRRDPSSTGGVLRTGPEPPTAVAGPPTAPDSAGNLYRAFTVRLGNFVHGGMRDLPKTINNGHTLISIAGNSASYAHSIGDRPLLVPLLTSTLPLP